MRKMIGFRVTGREVTITTRREWSLLIRPPSPNPIIRRTTRICSQWTFSEALWPGNSVVIQWGYNAKWVLGGDKLRKRQLRKIMLRL